MGLGRVSVRRVLVRGRCMRMSVSVLGVWGVQGSGWVGCPLPCRRQLQTELARARFARLDL